MPTFKDYLKEGKISTWQKLYRQSIVDFFFRKYKLKATIKYKPIKSKKFFGDVVLNNDSINKHIFTLRYNPDSGFEYMLMSILHELTHVKQTIKKHLSVDDKGTIILWKGKKVILVNDYKNIKYDEYKQLPWEVEAIKLSKSLPEEFYKSPEYLSLEGKDKSLDYIISLYK